MIFNDSNISSEENTLRLPAHEWASPRTTVLIIRLMKAAEILQPIS